jgi:hypothetical protein
MTSRVSNEQDKFYILLVTKEKRHVSDGLAGVACSVLRVLWFTVSFRGRLAATAELHCLRLLLVQFASAAQTYEMELCQQTSEALDHVLNQSISHPGIQTVHLQPPLLLLSATSDPLRPESLIATPSTGLQMSLTSDGGARASYSPVAVRSRWTRCNSSLI